MLAALLLALMLPAQDPVRVRADLLPDEVDLGQTATLRVEVQTDGARAQIQPFTSLPPGLELVGTRDFDQRQFTVPGGGRRFITREFRFRADAAGRYRIPAVTIIVDGETYATESRVLTVVRPLGRPDEPPLGPDGVVLRAWLDADTVHVGEQVNLHVEALFSQSARLRLRRAPEYEPPSPSGFWIQEIPEGRTPVTRGSRGEVYESQVFRRAFFPISPGQYEIPPARLFYEIRRGILQAPETFTVQSEPLRLVVLPIPEADRPAAFTGAVGRFELRSRLEPSRVPAGEAAVLTVELEGAGNVKALPPPRLPELPGVETFPPAEDAAVEIVGTTVQGRKRFSWVLVPERPGEIEIPEVEYAAFDPASGTFVTERTGPTTLFVEMGGAAAEPVAANTLRYLRTAPARTPAIEWVRTPWFALAQTAPLLLLAGALVYRRRTNGDPRVSRAALRRRRRAVVRGLEAAATDGTVDDIARVVQDARCWIADRLGIPIRDVTDADALARAGVPRDVAASTASVLARIDAIRYAPTPPGAESRAALLRSLARLLERIDRQAPRPRAAGQASGPGPAAAGVAGLAVALLLAAPVDARPQDVDPAFADGIALYDAGQYAEAADAFARYVRARRGDPAGWYNLGAAEHRAGRPGHAIQAWLAGLRLDPRNRDTRHNLRVAGAAPELVAHVAPPLPLRPDEMLLLASLAWFLALGVVTAGVLRNRRTGVAPAAAGMVAALGLLAAGWHTARPADTLVVLEPASLRVGPNLHAETLATLEPGTGVVRLTREGPWTRARTLDGLEGWLEAASAGSIPTP
jgi:tetratricopeptide (TPR) repeat protein